MTSRRLHAQPLTRRAVLALTGGTALTTALAGPAWSAGATRPGAAAPPRLTAADRKVVGAIRPGRALENLRYLSETIGQRYAGTPGEYAASQYLAGQLDRAGYVVETPSFAVPDVSLARIESSALPADLCWDCRSAGNAPTGVRVTGDLLPVIDAVVEQLPADVAGRWVLVRLGAGVPAVVTAAQERRAAGVVVVAAPGVPPRQSPPVRVDLATPSTIPVIGVGEVQGDVLADAAAATVPITVTTTAYRNLTSYNVIGTVPGTGRDRRNIMVSAHYDSVIGAKGANDDGSGTVLTLELARVLRRLPQLRHNLQFALWGAEEIGLVGSRQYVASLDPTERANLRAVLQNDMVGTSWEPAERYWVLSFDGLANLANQAVLDAGTRLGYRQRMSDVTLRGASDHQSFQEVGIASGNFSWRGADSPALLEPEYHSADDTIRENISVERLTASMEIIGTAAYALARA